MLLLKIIPALKVRGENFLGDLKISHHIRQTVQNYKVRTNKENAEEKRERQ